jgi:predicted phage terminase large subunit-like protein
MTRQQAVEFLRDRPVEFAHLLGLTKLGDLHNRWITDMVRGKGDHTLQASRNTYKTTSVSVALANILLLLPRKRVLFMRKTDDDVKEIVKQVQKILLDPHTQYFAQCIYGVGIRLTTQSANEVNTNLNTDIKGSSQLFGMGIGSSLTGKHFDFIFTDDIVNIKDRYSRAERDRTKLIYQELHNIVNRDGRIINTGTPWHPDDAFSVMPPAERYSCYHPEIKEIISDEQLQKIRESMLPSLFSANYELKHIASEDVIFTNPQTGADPAKVEQGTAHIDAAYGGEDYTAFSIVRKDGDTYYVYGRLWRKHVDDCEDKIIELRERFNAGKILCEDNGDKGYLAKSLRRRGERVSLYHENMNKHLKITSYLKGVWKNVVFVAGTDEEYINQICDYTEDAEHDDAPDSLASLVRVLWKKSGNQQNYVPIW